MHQDCALRTFHYRPFSALPLFSEHACSVPGVQRRTSVIYTPPVLKGYNSKLKELGTSVSDDALPFKICYLQQAISVTVQESDALGFWICGEGNGIILLSSQASSTASTKQQRILEGYTNCNAIGWLSLRLLGRLALPARECQENSISMLVPEPLPNSSE